MSKQPVPPPSVSKAGRGTPSITWTQRCAPDITGGNLKAYLKRYCFLCCLFCSSVSNLFLYLLEQFPI